MKTINISVNNLYSEWKPNKRSIISKTKKILNYYIEKIGALSCLNGMEYDSISFDILLCDSEETHALNKEYRDKDYAADIITFAIFADDENSFVIDGEINLGEIIIALDKVIAQVNKDVSMSKNREQELYFLISHGLMHLLGFDHETQEDYNFVIEEQKLALESINYDKI